MGTAASLFVNPAELDDLGAQPTAKALARRAKQRRQILTMIGASYVIDAGILSVYAEAGTIPVMVGPAYAATGLTVTALGILLWAMSSGQYDDLEGDAQRILLDEPQETPQIRP